MPERPKGADCKSAGVMPSEVRILPSPHENLSGSSSVGRASAFQADCRGFEPRLPLIGLPSGIWYLVKISWGQVFNVYSAHVAQLVEHILGKDEVTGSIPVMGS